MLRWRGLHQARSLIPTLSNAEQAGFLDRKLPRPIVPPCFRARTCTSKGIAQRVAGVGLLGVKRASDATRGKSRDNQPRSSAA